MRSWLPLVLILVCSGLAMACEDDPRDRDGTTSGGDSSDAGMGEN